MLLQSMDSPPEDHIEWITELKLDGHRMILSRFNGTTKLFTRHHNDVTWLYPELLEYEIDDGTMLDGELIAVDSEGKPDFEILQLRSRSRKNKAHLQFVAFDILFSNYKQVTSIPLSERKKLLAVSIPEDQQTLVVHNFIIGMATSYFHLIEENQLEGIVVKNPESIYKPNVRSNVWYKIINYMYIDVVVTKVRKSKFGLVATDTLGKYLGIIEFASTPIRKTFYTKMDPITESNDYVEIKPILCKVKFRNWTKNNLLRIPVLIEIIHH